MSILSNTVLAFSMSADAFAAAIGKGVGLHKPKLSYALRVGMIFGGVETLTPIIGWLLGLVASRFIASVDHWVAFGILAAIGGKMLFEGIFGGDEGKEKQQAHKLHLLILTAIGTSIDSMAVGVTLALVGANIWVMSLMIGAATCLMATIGIMAGHYIGRKAGKTAEVLGGLCLIAIGSKILFEHLTA
ncbi:MAG: manganese efflux pump [Proteobacteria bacterium]|nr:manganese efflux pump [Pseudomonadota bacterium]